MSQDDVRGSSAPATAAGDGWAGLKRVSSWRDGVFVALWGLVIAGYVVLMLRMGSKY